MGLRGPRFIDFPIGSPTVVSATEAARVQPVRPLAPAHDAFTRLLHRLEPASDALWAEVRPLIRPATGALVIDDSTLDKPRAKHIRRVAHHGSGNHRAVVRGINLITALWSDGDRLYPCDDRVSGQPTDGRTKNDQFGDLPAVATGSPPNASCSKAGTVGWTTGSGPGPWGGRGSPG